MKKTLVLAGGGHAHMMALVNLRQFIEKGHHVTVIGPSEYHYYSGMGPGMLGGTYRPDEIRFATRHLVEKNGGTFCLGKVVKIDAVERMVHMDSGKPVHYDVLSCNLGSHVNKNIVKGELNGIYTVKPIERLLEARQEIIALAQKRSIAIGIVGGGPSSVEISGNIHRLLQSPGMKQGIIKVLTRNTIMPHHPFKIRSKAAESMRRRGIEIVEGCKVQEIRTGFIKDSNGITHNFDIIFLASGVNPNSVFQDSGLDTGPDGGLLVNRYLQNPTHPEIFGGGDCIYFSEHPLDKVGVYAVRQNPVLLHNLMAALEGQPMKVFNPGGAYLLIFNLGDGTGIFHKWFIQFSGKMAFKIKNHIDRKFMLKFQAYEN